MENQLQNSINLALKSLENQEIITSDKSFYLYLGSFESAENADKKLLAVKTPRLSNFASKILTKIK